MTTTYLEQLARVARRIKRRHRATMACWAFTCLEVVVFNFVGIDRIFGFYDPISRCLLTAAAVTSLALLSYWFVRRSRVTVAPLDVALELEQRRPEYRSLLSSAVGFSEQDADDPTAGSSDLRRAVVLRALVALDGIDVEEVIPRAPLRRAAVAAAACIALLVVGGFFGPTILATGVARLVRPLGEEEWPRRHDLTFVDATQWVPVGGDFVAELRDRRGELPRSVEVQYRTKGAYGWAYERHTYGTSPATTGLKIRRPNVQSLFDYRARGGDHQSMSWHSVDVVPTPNIERLEITVHPPAYTGLPVQGASEQVRVLEGSMLQLNGRCGSVMRSATLRASREPDVPLEVSKDGRLFQTKAEGWLPKASSEWSIEVGVADGITVAAPQKLQVTVVPDCAPTVEILAPNDDVTVLPEASLNVRLAASDDLAVRTVRLRADTATSPDAANVSKRFTVYEGPQSPLGEPLDLDFLLDVSTLQPAVGTSWRLSAIAEDYAGHTTESARQLRVRIISKDEFTVLLHEQLTRLADVITTAHRDQLLAHDEFQKWRSERGKSKPSEEFRRSQAAQGSVVDALFRSKFSAKALSRSLARTLLENQWPDASLSAQLGDLSRNLDALYAERLGSLEERQEAISRLLGSTGDRHESSDNESLDALVGDIERHQTGALGVLEELEEMVSRWSDVQDFQRELAALKIDQRNLRREAESLAAQVEKDKGNDSGGGRKRKGEELGEAQRQLAAELEGLAQRMGQFATSLAETNPNEAKRLAAAANGAQHPDFVGDIQSAATALAEARFSDAVQKQNSIEQQLESLLSEFSKGTSADTAQRLARLEAEERRLFNEERAVNEYASRRQAVGSLERNAKQNELEELNSERQNLVSRMSDFSRRLERLRAQRAAEAIKEAAAELSETDSPTQSAVKASQDVKAARDELAKERRRQQALRANEELVALDQALSKLIIAQQAVVDASSKQMESSQLEESQATVRRDAMQAAELSNAFSVFARLVADAANEMQQAETKAAMGDREGFLQFASHALQQLRELADVVHRQIQKSSGSQQRARGDAKPQAQHNTDSLQAVELIAAQVALLRQMQADLRDQTSKLEQSYNVEGTDNERLGERAAALEQQQRELSELAKSLGESAKATFEEQVPIPGE